MCGIIYKITNKKNGKIYIGQTTLSLLERFSEHIHQSKKNRIDMPILNAIKKYGKENFYIEEIEKCFSQESLDKREIFWIKELCCQYNIRIGGRGGSLSEETKRKISASLKGKPSPAKGKIMSLEQKEKISKSNKGRKVSLEARKRMSFAKSGEKDPNAQLSTDQVIQIKGYLFKGDKVKNIAKIFDVGYHTIYSIKIGKTWKNVVV